MLEYDLHVASLEWQVERLTEVIIRAIRLKQPGLYDAGGEHVVGVFGIAVDW